MQVYTAGQLKKTFFKVQIIAPSNHMANNPKQISEQARDNQLVISSDDAAAITEMMVEVAAVYSTIREIDTTGFEAAGTFVPTPSKRESD
jgi:hypothetical protein